MLVTIVLLWKVKKLTEPVIVAAAALIGLIVFPLVVKAAGAEPARPPQAPALEQMFAEHEYGDGVHFAYRFLRNGTFSGTEMGKDVRGKWRLRGKEMCWTWTRQRGAEECYEASRNGAEITLYRDGVERWFGTLKPIVSTRP